MKMGNNGGWSYFWGWVTGALSALSLQDIVFAIGAAVTAVFTYLTYRSNDRRNKAAIAAEQERTRLYREYVTGGATDGEIKQVHAAVDVVGKSVTKHMEAES